MKVRTIVAFGLGGAALIASSQARAEYTGLTALYEYNDGAGHDIYRVYAEFTSPNDGVVICQGNSANPIHIQTRNADDSGLGTNFFNPGGATASGPPSPATSAINGTYVTIGIHDLSSYPPTPSYSGDVSDMVSLQLVPNFINNTNDFQNTNMAWYTSDGTHAAPFNWAFGNYIDSENDTATRVMIMQLAVNQGEHVRGTLNIGVIDGVNDGQLIVGQTFYGVPGPGGVGVLGIAGLAVRGGRRRRL